MPEMAARTLRLCLPPQKTPHAVRLLQEAHLSRLWNKSSLGSIQVFYDILLQK